MGHAYTSIPQTNANPLAASPSLCLPPSCPQLCNHFLLFFRVLSLRSDAT